MFPRLELHGALMALSSLLKSLHQEHPEPLSSLGIMRVSIQICIVQVDGIHKCSKCTASHWHHTGPYARWQITVPNGCRHTCQHMALVSQTIPLLLASFDSLLRGHD